MSEKFYIHENGEKREATPEEVVSFLELQEGCAESKAVEEAQAAARESALAKLAALGLTEEEIAAL
jgi:DNA-binding NarL/FixJ family response regulator